MPPLEVVEIKHYLDATSEASKRTRTVTITMVITSVLIFGALINSLQHQWMLERIRAFYHQGSAYSRAKILPPHERDRFGIEFDNPDAARDEAYCAQYPEYCHQHNAFYDAMVRAYVENALSVRVPLFGFSIDVNDLGILGGVALVVILLMYRFCLTRELDNLRIVKRKAKSIQNQSAPFYDVLAMRQVFTIPMSADLTPDKFLTLTPKLIWFFPLIIQTTVTLHDVITFSVGKAIHPGHNWVLIVVECLLLVLIGILTSMALTRIKRVDAEWHLWWCELHPSDDRGRAAGAQGQ